jgi:hypothetical protein
VEPADKGGRGDRSTEDEEDVNEDDVVVGGINQDRYLHNNRVSFICVFVGSGMRQHAHCSPVEKHG